MLHTHTLAVVIFLLLYLVKTFFLLAGKKELLEKFRKKTMVVEMIFSTVFLLTGIYLALNSGQISEGNWFWVKIALIVLIIPIGVIAFKKENKMLAVLGLLLIIYVYGISETKSINFKKEKSEGTLREISTPLEKVAVGTILYNEKCFSCHGTDGKLGMSGSKDLTKTTMTHEQIINIIRDGKGVMPTYRDLFSEQEMDAVAAFVESLKE